MESYRIAADFFLFNQVFLLLFVLVSTGICLLAFHVYRLTKQRQLKIFGVSFLALALAHVGMFAAELFRPEPIIPHFTQGTFPFFSFFVGIALTLYLIGLVLLSFMTLKTWEPKLPLLLGAVIAAAMLLERRPLFLFHVIATILLVFLGWYYWKIYAAQRHAIGSLLVFLAFLFLLLGNLTLVFAFHDMLCFTIGQSLQLAGYVCFLANLILVLRK